MRALLSRCAGNWDVIVPAAAAASLIVPGVAMVAAGHGNTSNIGAAMITMTLCVYLPFLIGYGLGIRKRQIPLRKAISEIHAGTGRVEAALAGVMPSDQGELQPPARRRFTVVSGSEG